MELILTTALTLFIVLDPFGNLAVFHTVLSTTPEEKRGRILVRELLIALFVLMLFLFCGQPLLHFLGLEQSTLRMSGGIILFLISLGMVFPTKSVLGGEGDEEPFIVPLAIPLVAGPPALIFTPYFSPTAQCQYRRNRHRNVLGMVRLRDHPVSIPLLHAFPRQKRHPSTRATNGNAPRDDFCANVYGWAGGIPTITLSSHHDCQTRDIRGTSPRSWFPLCGETNRHGLRCGWYN